MDTVDEGLSWQSDRSARQRLTDTPMNTRSDTFGTAAPRDALNTDTAPPASAAGQKNALDSTSPPTSSWWSTLEPLCFAVVLAILMLALGGWFSQPAHGKEAHPAHHLAAAPR